jgi:hypothetical protein
MFTGSLCRTLHGHLLTLRLHYHFTDDGLWFEQLHLRLRKVFAACSILLDPHQSQTLFQHTNLQLRKLQPAFQLCDELQIGWRRRNGSFTHDGLLIYQSRSKRSSKLMQQHVLLVELSGTTACERFIVT